MNMTLSCSRRIFASSKKVKLMNRGCLQILHVTVVQERNEEGEKVCVIRWETKKKCHWQCNLMHSVTTKERHSPVQYRKVKKGCGEIQSDKRSSHKRTEEAENFDGLLVLRRESCQRGGESHILYGLFGAETERESSIYLSNNTHSLIFRKCVGSQTVRFKESSDRYRHAHRLSAV